MYCYILLFQIVGIISVFFICVSIVSFCLKTHPDMRVPVIRNITVNTANKTTAWVLDKTQTNAHEFFFYIECICNGWFTFEILVSLYYEHFCVFSTQFSTSCLFSLSFLFSFFYRFGSYLRLVNVSSLCRL